MATQLSRQLNLPAPEAARLLLGSELIRSIDGQEIIVRIVETEAYDALDEASHTFKGLTPRTAAMFGPAGFAYIYFTYGMHFCFNVVTGSEEEGAGVLVRAVEPIKGLTLIEQFRAPITGRNLTNGPGKVCRSLKIDKSLYGHDLSREPLRLNLSQEISPGNIIQTTRIGIKKAVEKPWRFYIEDNIFVSKL